MAFFSSVVLPSKSLFSMSTTTGPMLSLNCKNGVDDFNTMESVMSSNSTLTESSSEGSWLMPVMAMYSYGTLSSMTILLISSATWESIPSTEKIFGMLVIFGSLSLMHS